MAENSKIEWTDHTYNPWVGCTKISPACDHCYAENWAMRTGQGELWNGKRRLTSTERDVRRWQHEAELSGRRPWVFCASLADVFDNEVPDTWRESLWGLIRMTPLLKWQLLTKRIGNVPKMLPKDWTPASAYEHVGFMATLANQEEADRDLPKLIALKFNFNVRWVGISYEPALGPLDLRRIYDRMSPGTAGIAKGMPYLDWVIAGGESGPKARPAHPEWFRAVRDACADAGVPFMFKQWGEWAPHAQHSRVATALHPWSPTQMMAKVGKRRAGRLLDGREHNGFPRVYGEEEAHAQATP